MRRFTVLCILFVTMAASRLCAGEFDWMVRQFAAESGTPATHIPFMGFARFVVAVGHPAGASDFHLAIFENSRLDPERFSQNLRDTTGPGWKPIVRVRSRDGESTNIYVQEAGKHIRVLIGSFEHGEATLVQVRIKPERLIQFVDDHRASRK
jgi:hypothetical protein